MDIAEKQEPRPPGFFRDFRLKLRKDVQVGKQRVGDVQVIVVTAAPAKRFAIFDAFKVTRGDAMFFENVDVVEVAADYADDTDVGKEAGGNREVRSGTAEHLVALAKGGFNCVVSDGTNN